MRAFANELFAVWEMNASVTGVRSVKLCRTTRPQQLLKWNKVFSFSFFHRTEVKSRID